MADGWTVEGHAAARLDAMGAYDAEWIGSGEWERLLFRTPCPADGCPGMEWSWPAHGGGPTPDGCGHPEKTSGCEGRRGA